MPETALIPMLLSVTPFSEGTSALIRPRAAPGDSAIQSTESGEPLETVPPVRAT